MNDSANQAGLLLIRVRRFFLDTTAGQLETPQDRLDLLVGTGMSHVAEEIYKASSPRAFVGNLLYLIASESQPTFVNFLRGFGEWANLGIAAQSTLRNLLTDIESCSPERWDRELADARIPLTDPLGKYAGSAIYQLVVPYEFDLDLLSRAVRNNYRNGELKGFAVANVSSLFLDNLAKRLKNDIGRSRTYCHPNTLKIHPLQMPLDTVVATIRGRAAPRLQQQHVIFSVRGLADERQLSAFWDDMKSAVLRLKMARCLLVIMGLDAALALPEDVISLPAPSFERADLQIWIGHLVQELQWPLDAEDSWFDIVWSCASRDGVLSIGLMYEHLIFTEQQLQRSRSWNEFCSALEEWREIYEY